MQFAILTNALKQGAKRRLKQLFIASTGCVILAAMPAGLNADALSAGARLASDQEFAVKHAPQPVSVRNANDFESTWPPSGTGGGAGV